MHTGTLILWDVDATLLTTGGIGGQVMRSAMAQVFGEMGARERTFFSGKTDRQIIHEAFPNITPEALAMQLDRFRSVYVTEFERRRADLEAHARPLAGAVDVLRHLHGRVVQAPLTGNIAPIARLKLELVGLLPFVDASIGGYGDDHHDRAQLLPVAVERATRHYQRLFRTQDVIIVGDTPNDIRCGRFSGARTVAVATGPYSLEELQAHEPDALLPDLADLPAVLHALFGTAPLP
ncbi:MAG: HAD hydrolase-like protein [Chloroflexaceae bacterium]|nr:HAD hydrolase-like protein [Chloroflexaceae bacterium]